MTKPTEWLFVIVLVIALIIGILYLNERISAKCFDFWPFKGTACIAVTR